MLSPPDAQGGLLAAQPRRWRYLRVRLCFSESGTPVDAQAFMMLILRAVRSMFGLAGEAQPVSLVRYDEDLREGILRTSTAALKQLWCSLTSVTECDRRPCHMRWSRSLGVASAHNPRPCGLLRSEGSDCSRDCGFFGALHAATAPASLDPSEGWPTEHADQSAATGFQETYFSELKPRGQASSNQAIL